MDHPYPASWSPGLMLTVVQAFALSYASNTPVSRPTSKPVPAFPYLAAGRSPSQLTNSSALPLARVHARAEIWASGGLLRLTTESTSVRADPSRAPPRARIENRGVCGVSNTANGGFRGPHNTSTVRCAQRGERIASLNAMPCRRVPATRSWRSLISALVAHTLRQ